MLRRCMTPNPHSNSKHLTQLCEGLHLNKKESNKVSFDSFFYVDRLTNNKIQLGEAKQVYTQKQKRASRQHQQHNSGAIPTRGKKKNSATISKHKQYSQSKEMQEINDCYSIMKSTKLFQMDNLKNKIFYKGENPMNKNKQNDIQEMIKKKKRIRQFIEQYVSELCLNQFRNYMKLSDSRDKVRLINPNLLNIHKMLSNKISKQHIEKIIQQFLQSQNSEKQKKKPSHNDKMNQLDFPDEYRLKELLMHRMLVKNKQFQHLISPRKQNPFDYKTNSRAQLAQPVFNPGSQLELEGYQFKEFQEGDIPKVEKTKQIGWKAADRKIEMKKRQLLLAIQSGSIYDFLFLIIRWPTLLNYKDKLGNSLLHIAAKQNQAQIYSILIKKLGISSLKEKNNCGKTPVEIAFLFGSHEIEKINLEYHHYL